MKAIIEWAQNSSPWEFIGGLILGAIVVRIIWEVITNK